MTSFQLFKESCLAALRSINRSDPAGLLRRHLLLDRLAQLRLIHMAETYFNGYLLLLREKNQELLNAREQHTRHLVRAEKLAALGQLAAGVAHELNNPLATIANYVEDLLDLCHEGPGALSSNASDVARHLESVKAQIHRCKKITQDMLDLARTKAPCLEEVDVAQVIRRAVEVAAAYRNEKRSPIFVAVPDLPPIHSDPFLLEQIFLNLLRNSLDAIGPEGRIELSAGRLDRCVFVEIRDDGCGIPPEHLDRVFDPFFTTKPVGKGTGLGLAICYTLLEKLGGEISLSSHPGEGTTVRIVVPVRASRP